MKLSYCTTCHDRLWQLLITLEHNLAYTVAGEVQIVILAYNDLGAATYLRNNYQEYIADERLRVVTLNDKVKYLDGTNWSCGPIKHHVHNIAEGKIVFNLDADNFIDADLQNILLKLKPQEIVVNEIKTWTTDGRSGRIGMSKYLYKKTGGYVDSGRRDDGDIMDKAKKLKATFIQVPCVIKPIPNDRSEYESGL